MQEFNLYKQKAINDCKLFTYEEKVKGLWSQKDIYKYFDSIDIDDAHKILIANLAKEKNKVKNILIIGGGTGRLGRYIAKNYTTIHVIEIDKSKHMCEHANFLAQKENILNFTSINASCIKIPFEDNYFDYTIAYGVFRYIHKTDYEKSIKEVIRTCKNTFIISEPILYNNIRTLKKYIFNTTRIAYSKEKVTVLRMSLFYMLYRMYKKDQKFKKIVDSKNKNYITTLIKIAGTKSGFLHSLICKK